MLTCYVIAHSLWMEIRTPEAVYIYNVDNINYIMDSADHPGVFHITTNDFHRTIYLERVTISDFNDCLIKVYDK